jgi:hypothetical protein
MFGVRRYGDGMSKKAKQAKMPVHPRAAFALRKLSIEAEIPTAADHLSRFSGVSASELLAEAVRYVRAGGQLPGAYLPPDDDREPVAVARSVRNDVRDLLDESLQPDAAASVRALFGAGYSDFVMRVVGHVRAGGTLTVPAVPAAA